MSLISGSLKKLEMRRKNKIKKRLTFKIRCDLIHILKIIQEKIMEERDLFEDFDNIIFEDDHINWKELAEDVNKNNNNKSEVKK